MIRAALIALALAALSLCVHPDGAQISSAPTHMHS
jgi:hypothetical protein